MAYDMAVKKINTCDIIFFLVQNVTSHIEENM